MLYKLHNNIFIVSLLVFGLIVALAFQKAMNLMALASLVSLLTQLALLVYYSHENEADYSERNLFFTTLLYTISLGAIFIMISEYYDGDSFLFSKADAMYYYGISSKVWDIGLINNVTRIVDNYTFEDWGAILFDTVALYIVPDKLFVNFINTVTGAIGTVYLFRIGKLFMPESYAYLGALAYGTSSFMIFFHCSFLKESMFAFVVINALYYFYRSIAYDSSRSIIGVAISLGLLFFYRPAVAAFIGVSIFVYYGIKKRGSAISLFIYMIAAGLVLATLTTMQYAIESNTAGGDMDAVLADTSNKSYSGGFNIFMSFFAAFFGPFPALLQRFEEPTYVEFLGAGLTYKLFLVGPFWYGVYIAIKKWMVELFPIIIFILVEMAATGYVMASLELRKVIPHIPFMYTLAYFGIYKGFQPTKISHLSALPTYLFVIAVVLLWNVIKVKT